MNPSDGAKLEELVKCSEIAYGLDERTDPSRVDEGSLVWLAESAYSLGRESRTQELKQAARKLYDGDVPGMQENFSGTPKDAYENGWIGGVEAVFDVCEAIQKEGKVT